MFSQHQDGERGTGWVVAQFVLLGAIAVAPRSAWSSTLQRPAHIAGFIAGGAGTLVALLGARTLGRNLTPFPRPRDDGALVQTGIYGVVRHPIYTGLLLGALGWALVRGSTTALLLTGALGLLFDCKASREEQWLAAQFSGYGAYRRRVKKLLPWVY